MQIAGMTDKRMARGTRLGFGVNNSKKASAPVLQLVRLDRIISTQIRVLEPVLDRYGNAFKNPVGYRETRQVMEIPGIFPGSGYVPAGTVTDFVPSKEIGSSISSNGEMSSQPQWRSP